MRNICARAIGLLALIFVAACVPISESGETGALSTAASTSAAASDSATPMPPATSEPPTPAPTETPVLSTENVALLGFGRASAWSESAHLAIDGDLETMWSARALPVQWYAVLLDDFYLLERIELVIAQAPAGPTTHDVWLGNGSGTQSLYKRLANVHTEDGQVLEIVIDPPRNANEVYIRTYANPSWVAWREVRVFGSPSLDPMAGTGGGRWRLKKFAAGLDLPVQVTHAGDGSRRLFVVEQKGRIRIIKDGVINDTPFLDLSARISCCGERGLFGIAFPPDYAAKQHFYVSFTNLDGHTVINRYTTTADPDKADPDSEEVVLTIEQLGDSHNGGRMGFGPKDGYLYIGSGDGGSRKQVMDGGQNPGTLLGKILRIDVESGVYPYAIPAGNPFIGVEGYRDEIWALGLRNPWGFAFDKLTGDLYIADVGNLAHEEVNYQPAASGGGENYGWNTMEGTLCFTPEFCSTAGLILPVAEYGHQRGCAIVGGAVYRGNSYPALQGAYIFADFCRGTVWVLTRPDANMPDAWLSSLLLDAAVPVSSIGEDEEGNVYVVGHQGGFIALITQR